MSRFPFENSDYAGLYRKRREKKQEEDDDGEYVCRTRSCASPRDSAHFAYTIGRRPPTTIEKAKGLLHTRLVDMGKRTCVLDFNEPYYPGGKKSKIYLQENDEDFQRMYSDLVKVYDKYGIPHPCISAKYYDPSDDDLNSSTGKLIGHREPSNKELKKHRKEASKDPNTITFYPDGRLHKHGAALDTYDKPDDKNFIAFKKEVNDVLSKHYIRAHGVEFDFRDSQSYLILDRYQTRC